MSNTQIEFKQLASLGDQKYPAFELRHLFSELRQQGHTQSCEQIIDDLQLSDLDNAAFIESHQALEGLSRAVNQHFHVGFGLRIAKHYQLEDFGDLGIALRHASSLHDALNIALGYYELLGSFTDLTIVQSEQALSIRLVNVSGLGAELLHLLFELTVGGMVSIGKAIANREIETALIRTELALTESEKHIIEQRFNCEVEAQADFNEWVVPLEPLQRAIDHPEPSKEQLDQSITSLNELMLSLKNEYALVDRFDQLARQNEASFPNSKEIADALHMSERTFRRKLGKIGVNYNLLMSKIRCQLAIAMLQRGEHTNEDIAFELGFSDAANFCNAFKKWTGHTPNFYRI